MAALAWKLTALGLAFHIYADDVILYQELDVPNAALASSALQKRTECYSRMDEGESANAERQ
jgi:hypothetical protein